MKITIDINTDNSAFWNHCEDSDKPIFNNSEVERILKDMSLEISYLDSGKSKDINGNTVASFTVERDN